jgi:DeoR family transcriptional regulator of aga operon/DeoR family fructose operon transcriptional repressor
MADSLPQISIDFNYILDIAFRWRLRFVGKQPKPALQTCPSSDFPSRTRGAALTIPAGASSGEVFARERQERIARLVEEHGRARVTDLAGQFRVSTVTIRKDLLALESAGRLVRAHGGAIALDRSRPELAFEIRERLQTEEKLRIGVAAAALVHDGESIVMDASTTALSVARQLKARGGWSQLTVITNGLRIASELAGHPGIVVLMLGGRVRWEALSVVGQLGDGLFSRINVQKAFLGAAGFTLESGLADATDEEAQIKRSMVTAAREVIAIVDHTKWERAAFATFCPTADISVVLTDERAPEAMVRALDGRGIGVRLVGAEVAPEHDSTGRPDTTRSSR